MCPWHWFSGKGRGGRSNGLWKSTNPSLLPLKYSFFVSLLFSREGVQLVKHCGNTRMISGYFEDGMRTPWLHVVTAFKGFTTHSLLQLWQQSSPYPRRQEVQRHSHCKLNTLLQSHLLTLQMHIGRGQKSVLTKVDELPSRLTYICQVKQSLKTTNLPIISFLLHTGSKCS